jgi:hypothetical protein
VLRDEIDERPTSTVRDELLERDAADVVGHHAVDAAREPAVVAAAAATLPRRYGDDDDEYLVSACAL